ncbi:bifunctional diaminohydroxyphosphoribosylaminopyrimidine deaminase/5-amino-6-(5-phosphoribosylamino)uracil reductase RibD [Helicobacter sp. 23-1044]
MELDFYMDLALRKAWENQLLALPNPSVGALILDKNGRILSLEAHSKCGDCHAELKAAKSAYIALKGVDFEILQTLKNANEIFDFLVANHSGILRDSSIFVTLEPCNHYGKTPPCAELLKALGFRHIIFSVDESGENSRGGAENLSKFGVKITRGVLQDKGRDLLYPFERLRKNGRLSVFKIAQRLNGSFEGGIISSEDSRIFSHKLREIAKRIIISAKTILNDNPLLDSRLAKSAKAPNVCIFGSESSLKKCEDKTLKIYSVKNRQITLHSDICDILQDGFSIIEGGGKSFALFRDKIDLLLVFISPKITAGRNFHSDFGGRILHSTQIGEDIVLWIKPF